MKLTHYIYLSTALAMLTACGEDIEPVYTVGEADNAIVLSAGVIDDLGKAETRGRTRADENHDPLPDNKGGGHVGFVSGNKLNLQVKGFWKDHKVNGTDSQDITKTTIATVGAAENMHNPISSYNQPLYWDDYGTADPKNMETGGGRAQGLTIYGAAVNEANVTDASNNNAPDVTKWDDYVWSLGVNQINGWSQKDLVISNNVKGDNTYKFDSRTDGKLLEFKHAMSKVTVNLFAGEGFPSKFEESASVTLKNFYYTGSVNIETGATTPSKANVSDIDAFLENESVQLPELKFTALVFPGRSFTEGEKVISVSVDGNNYFVKADKMIAAMDVLSTKQTEMLSGYNYVFNITVNKTKIEVEATIQDWKSVNAEMDYPKIDFDKTYGHTGNAMPANSEFSFYRSTAIDGSYFESGNSSVVTYDGTKYTMTDPLYWPTHSIHYFFRGIWPKVGSTNGPTTEKVHNLEGTTKSVVDVKNEAYNQGKYPSDLMIARPLNPDDKTPDETCKNPEHLDENSKAPEGICATEGKINMNFNYMMSQIIVKLETEEAEGALNKVTFNDQTKVEIIGGYDKGCISLGNRTSIFSDSDKNDYRMNNSKDASNNTLYTSYHDAIVPQALVDNPEASAPNPTLRFRVTVADNATSPKDVYETIGGISSIPVRESTGPDTWSDPMSIKVWEPGKIYTYTLKITKTEIKVTATVTDWIPVQASTEVWF